MCVCKTHSDRLYDVLLTFTTRRYPCNKPLCAAKVVSQGWIAVIVLRCCSMLFKVTCEDMLLYVIYEYLFLRQENFIRGSPSSHTAPPGEAER